MADEVGKDASRIKVAGAFLAIYVFWGSTYLAIKVLVASVPPLTAAGVRFLIAGSIVYCWARLRGAPRPSRPQQRNLATIGLVMFVPVYAAVFWAERSVPSGVTAVFAATLPLWTVLIEASVLRRRVVTRGLALALLIGFAGVALVSTNASHGARVIPLLPCVAVIFGEMSWAAASVMTKRLDLPASSLVTAGGEMLWGGALLLVGGALVGEWRVVPMVSLAAVGAMAYLILIGSIVAFTAYIWLLGRTSATRLSSYSYVNPVVALAIGYAFAGERLAPRALWASILVLISVVLIAWASRRPAGTVPRTRLAGGRAGRAPARPAAQCPAD